MFCQLRAEEQWPECTIQALAAESRPRLPLSANNLTALINVYLLNIYEYDPFGTSSLNDNIIKTQTVLIMQAGFASVFYDDEAVLIILRELYAALLFIVKKSACSESNPTVYLALSANKTFHFSIRRYL